MKNNAELIMFTKQNRADDLKQWVDYHLAIGFDKITIYDNVSTFSVTELFESYKNVNVIYSTIPLDNNKKGFDNKNIIVTEFCMEKKEETQWIAWLDEDEYLYSKNNAKITDLLDNNFKTISFYWKMISLPNVIESRKLSVIDTFNYFSLQTPCSNEAHVRTIVNTNKFTNINFLSCHMPNLDGFPLESRMPNGEYIYTESMSIEGFKFYDEQPIVLYHYYHQSWEDWVWKCYRGGLDENGKYYSFQGRKSFEEAIVGKYIYEDNSMIIRKKELGI